MGRQNEVIQRLNSMLQDTTIENVRWVDDYSPEGGQSFSVDNTYKSIQVSKLFVSR